MLHSEKIEQVAAAVAKAAGEMPAVPKDSTNPHFKSKFASLDGIIERTKPVLAANGLAIVQGTADDSAPGTVTVETMLLHKSGEWLMSQVVMPLAKNDPQGVGSAITYGRRYLVAAMLSLAADEDDDGNGSSHKPEAVRAAEKKGAKPVALDDPNVMPTGDYHGQPLAAVPTKELQALAAWCEKRDARKYAARITAIDTEIAKRHMAKTDDERVADMKKAAEQDEKNLELLQTG